MYLLIVKLLEKKRECFKQKKNIEFLKYNDPDKGSFIAVAKDFIPVGSYSL